MSIAWVFIRKFWPLFVIVPLVFTILFMRNSLTKSNADRDAAKVQVATVTEANKSLSDALKKVEQTRVDNDAIAVAVAKLLGGNNTRLVETRTVIERLKRDDPAIRSWGAVPVPSRVREALRARPKHTDAP